MSSGRGDGHPLAHMWPGVPLALGSAVLFGLSTPLAKIMLGSVDPWLTAGLLYLGAGLGLAIVRLGRSALGPLHEEAPLRRQDLPWIAGVVFAGGVVGPLLLMLGLARTGAAQASLLLNLEGLATLAIAWFIYRENVDRRLAAGALAILAGGAALTFDGSVFALDVGAILIVGACLAWGIDNNLTRKLSSADPLQITMIKGLAAGSINLALALGQGAAIPTGAALLGVALIGFVGYGVSLVFFVLGLRHLGAARTGAYFALAPFIGSIASIAMLGERIEPSLVIAAALMLFGLWIHLTERHEHEHRHDATEHEHRHVHDAHHRHGHGPDDPPGEPHSHRHVHAPLIHRHPHYPDLHHRHGH